MFSFEQSQLSGCSPKLNPNEQVWNNMKRKLVRAAPKTRETFIQFIHSKMRKLQTAPKIYAGFSECLTRNMFTDRVTIDQKKSTISGGELPMGEYQ